MPTVPIPLFTEAYRNVDGTVAKDNNWRLVNGYRDDLTAINSRPGLAYIDSFHPSRGSPINGLYWWDAKGSLIIVGGGNTTLLGFNGSNYSKVDLTGDLLVGTGKASFASDGSSVFIANGGRIIYSNGVAASAYIADADCPTVVTHIGWLDGYLIALSDNTVYYSDINDPFTWVATDFFTNPGNPDKTIAMAIRQREIYLFGTASVEIWENDGETPFSRIPGGFINVGCIAKDSIVEIESGLYWLDSNRRFSRFANRTPEVISSPYDKEIQGFGDVSDCNGFRVVIDGSEFILWSFKGPNRTLVYNPRLQDWYEWGAWNSTTNTFNQFLGGAGAFCPGWGKVMVGSWQQPYLYEMRADTDTDDGAVIRVLRQSGHIDYSTMKDKRSNEIRLRLKRGDQENSYSSPPELMVRWRDDNSPYWSDEHLISLGAPGDSSILQRIFRTGIYSTRQYELAFTGGVKFVVSGAEEEIEVLR